MHQAHVPAHEAVDASGQALAPVLVEWRRDLGWTQEELATRAGISRGYLSNLERGVTGRPGIDVLAAVCGAMGRSWVDLFAAAGVPLPGDVTLADLHDGVHDAELFHYLRRLPELDARDRHTLTALLRAFFGRDEHVSEQRRPNMHQLALPAANQAELSEIDHD